MGNAVLDGRVGRERASAVAGQTQGGYKYYVLAVLTLVYTLAFVDRQVIVILAEDIKSDLVLSDTQLGVLTGFAFALFYVGLGIPVARLADRWNRISILSAALAIWSGMTATCAAAGSFVQLALARFGVGIGEAGCNPPAYSVIADYFPPRNRATALAVYASAGTSIGILVGFAVGGLLAEIYGWRAAFLWVGLPGVALALVVWLSVREPEREGYAAAGDRAPRIADVLRQLLASRTFVFVSLAVACNAFAIYAVLNWLPVFMIRVYGASPSQVGPALGLLFGVGMGAGGILVGWLCDRRARRDRRYYVWIPAAGVALTPALYGCALFSPSMSASLMWAIVPTLFINCTAGPVLTVIMGLVETRARALVSSLFLLVVNVAGLGISPIAVGALSDALTPLAGARGIAYAIAAALLMNWVSAGLFLVAAGSIRRDLARMERFTRAR